MTTVDANARVVAADSVPSSVVWRAFLEGFRDYVVPVEIGETPFANLLAAEHIDLAASCVALDPFGDPVGICLLAIRDRDGWCGGLGVTPGGRRRGLGRRLMAHTIEVARARGLDRIRLECIDGNGAALDLYLGMGFSVLRRLDLFDGVVAIGSRVAASFPVHDVLAPSALWDRFAEYHAIRRPWQHDLTTMRFTVPVDSLLGIGHGKDPTRPETYLLFRSPDASSGKVAIVDAGVLDGHRAAVAVLETLVLECAKRHPGHRFRAPNVPDDDPLNLALRSLGVLASMSQSEMELDLASPPHGETWSS